MKAETLTIEPQTTDVGGSKSKKDEQAGKYGTFSGVFTPTVLTILGVILFLREGAVVGNAGLVGALLIITIAFAISACTALSMSSIITNIRLGAGGAYSIISQSFGLEVGGGVGIPFYLSQGLATAMYVIGFREGWRLIFPNHPAIYVDFITFGVLFAIAFISAKLAFRIQYLIMLVIAVSLVSLVASIYSGALQYTPQLWGSFPGFPENNFADTNFWFVFAVFFPAATGIMAGANMSGDLKNASRSVPLGTLAAIGISYLIYVAVAIWLSMVATPKELVESYTILIERSFWQPAAIAGLLGATFSSGLSSLVGAPRILQALADHGVTFFGKDWLAKKSSGGEPRNALFFTGIIVAAALMMRELTTVAALITMFLLLTYAVLNGVLFIKQSLGLISFRPTFRVPKFIPIVGMLGCLVSMFIINPLFSVVALLIVFALYYLMRRKNLDSPFGDVRSGLLISTAEWWARRIAQLAEQKGRAWKPNLLIPVEDAQNFRGRFHLIYDIAYPKGSVYLLGMTEDFYETPLKDEMPDLKKSLEDEDIFAYSTIIESKSFGDDMLTTMQAVSGSFLRPNLLFLPLFAASDERREQDLEKIIKRVEESHLGVILFAEHQQARLGHRQKINVWITDQSPHWDVAQKESNLDLQLLLAYQIAQNWEGAINILTAISEEKYEETAEEYLEDLVAYARLPRAEIEVCAGDFKSCLENAPRADLNIFGLSENVNFDFFREMVETTKSTCIFVRDSGEEDVLA